MKAPVLFFLMILTVNQHITGARMSTYQYSTMKSLGRAGGHSVYGLRTRDKKLRTIKPSLYLCAGVHGDEPAGVVGLLDWAQANTNILAKRNVVIFPCFNPWGLENNMRYDADGADLNRLFQAGQRCGVADAVQSFHYLWSAGA